MTRKESRATPLATVGPRNVISSAARDIRNNSQTRLELQQDFALAYIVARTGVAIETARVYAELNRFGEARS